MFVPELSTVTLWNSLELHKDTELASLFARVVDENEVSQNPVCLFYKKRSTYEKVEAT